jgi:hypothetical protein
MTSAAETVTCHIHDLGEGAVMLLRIATHRVLQPGDGLRGPDMVLPAYLGRFGKLYPQKRTLAESVGMSVKCQ